MSTATEQFRAEYRRDEITPSYSGIVHFWFTSISGIALIVVCISQVNNVTPLEWLTVPFTFLYANLAEYWGHRGPMHHPVKGLKIIFRRHAGQHHRFFTNAEMSFDTSQDYKAVLFPPLMIVFFMAGFGLPYWLVLSFLATSNAGWIGVAVAIAYFLNYEWLHFAYHCPDDSWARRVPGVNMLRRLHRDHHDPALMQKYNFNITYPMGDWLFGTRYRG